MILREYEPGTVNPSLDPLNHVILTWDFYHDIRDDRELTTREVQRSITRSLRIYKEDILENRLNNENTAFPLSQELRDDIKESYDENPLDYKLKEVPTEFKDEREYWHCYLPLFLLELQMNIERAKDNELSQAELFSFKEIREHHQSFIIKFHKNQASGIHFFHSDLVLLSLNDEHGTCPDGQHIESPDPNIPNPYHCIGVVEASSFESLDIRIYLGYHEELDNVERYVTNAYKRANLTTKLTTAEEGNEETGDTGDKNDSNNNQSTLSPAEQFGVMKFPSRKTVIQALVNHIQSENPWHIARIMGSATFAREFQALMSLELIPLRSDLLLKPVSKREKRLRELIKSGKLKYISKRMKKRHKFLQEEKVENLEVPPNLEKVLFDPKKHNTSQIEAMQSCLKSRGITLIQGPPGTGKTTTIVSILSLILASKMPKDTRKNETTKTLVDQNTIRTSEEIKIKQFGQRQNYLKNDYRHMYDVAKQTVDQHENEVMYQKAHRVDQNELFDMAIDAGESTKRILVCAPSNAAVDEILKRVVKSTEQGGGLLDENGENFTPSVARVGPNVHDSLKRYSLEEKINVILQSKAGQGLQRDEVKNEALKDVSIVFATLSMCGSRDMTSFTDGFDTVVVDEAGQAVEISSLIPMRLDCQRLIMVGDPKQLSATVFSSNAVALKYDQSLFQRLESGNKRKSMLSYQYRMHPKISAFPRTRFYNNPEERQSDLLMNKLYSNKITSSGLLDAPNIIDICKTPHTNWYKTYNKPTSSINASVTDNANNDSSINGQTSGAQTNNQTTAASSEEGFGVLFQPIKFIHVAGSEQKVNQSIVNEDEIKIVMEYVKMLVAALLCLLKKDKPNLVLDSKCSHLEALFTKIAIITPYAEQVKALRRAVKINYAHLGFEKSPIDINTVDGFQGQEKDHIIFSCVRSKNREEMSAMEKRANIGFLDDERRMNVALTRSRLNLVIVGNRDYLADASDKLWRQLINYCSEQNCISNLERTAEMRDIYLARWERHKKRDNADHGSEEKFWHEELPDLYHQIKFDTPTEIVDECNLCEKSTTSKVIEVQS